MKHLVFILLVVPFAGKSQKIEMLSSEKKVSIRGLSVVSDQVIWVSGNNGQVGKSIDGGKTWLWRVVKGFEKRDFRDIEAFDAATAVIIAIAEPANILKTMDGGETWKVVYENSTKGMFLDAMEFWDRYSGIVIGDPINGKFFVARTFDEGDTWREIKESNLPKADSGEACFAASGTNVRVLDKDEACFVSGGLRSRFFWKGQPITMPIVQGKESTGANSIAVRDRNKVNNSLHFVVVGGDFANDTSSLNNCFYTRDGGKHWIAPQTPPHGYRSCVEYITKDKLISCGTTGIDISSDGGKNWQLISKEGFHVCRKSKKGNAVFLAGANGKIAKLVNE
ncbi:MAG TPA: oxidoreductase [Chitinophagaceae bacterium]|nr:oxidoreductase [Chitinophagaceae bacterium]